MSVFTHEEVCRFEIEAELAQACPRCVRAPRRLPPLAFAALCAYALAVLIAGAVALHSAQMLWLSRFGRLQRASLVAFQTVPRSSSDGSSAALIPTVLSDSADDLTGTLRENYAFVLNGKKYQGWTSVGDTFGAPSAGAPDAGELSSLDVSNGGSGASAASASILVRTGWWLGRFVYLPVAMIPPASGSAALALAAALALTLVGWSACTRARVLIRAYRLLSHGDALIATVRDKEITRGEVPRYWVTCGFIALSGEIVSWRERCAPEQWRDLQIGDAVTVLHLPTRSGALTAALYRHLPLACISRSRAAVQFKQLR